MEKSQSLIPLCWEHGRFLLWIIEVHLITPGVVLKAHVEASQWE